MDDQYRITLSKSGPNGTTHEEISVTHKLSEIRRIVDIALAIHGGSGEAAPEFITELIASEKATLTFTWPNGFKTLHAQLVS